MTRYRESYHQTLREYEQERRRREAGMSTAAQTQVPEQGGSEPGSPHTTVRTKEPDLDKHLVIDRYRRSSLIDHFLAPGVALESFAQQRFDEQGNFVEQPYTAEVQQDEKGLTVTLTRDGQVKRAGAMSAVPVHVSKTLFVPLGEERLVVGYSITNKGQSRLQTRFACEWNMHLLGGGHNDQAYYQIGDQREFFDSTGEVANVEDFAVGNRWLHQDMHFNLSKAATLWRFSIETITGSEAGFERNHQGSCLTLVWDVVLEAGESWEVEIVCTGKEI
jgi:alpha-amylase